MAGTSNTQLRKLRKIQELRNRILKETDPKQIEILTKILKAYEVGKKGDGR